MRPVVGVRPHEVLLGEGGTGEAHRGTVQVVETLGFESFVHVDLDSGDKVVARVEGPPPARGPVSVRLGRTYRFDRNTGARIRPNSEA